MKESKVIEGGENFDLRKMFLNGRKQSLNERVQFFKNFIDTLKTNNEFQHMRIISSAADREVFVRDSYSGANKKMLMFGSNNYLGFANHPYIKQKVKETISKFGCGIGGPPLLNGYT